VLPRPIFVREDREATGGGNGLLAPGLDASGKGGKGGKRGARGKGGYGEVGGRQVFVGNLAPETDWRELKAHLLGGAEGFLAVERVEIASHPGGSGGGPGGPGSSKGFGTARFPTPAAAQRAIQRLHGSELRGRRLEVRLDRRAAGY